MKYTQQYIQQRVVVCEQTGCWNWIRAIGSHGYGAADAGRVLAHRLAYELFVGPIGNGLVLHKCDNRRCCNPEHLFLGTHSDNSRDAYTKGRLKPPPGKLTDDQVREIRRRALAGESQTRLAREFNVHQPCVSRIKTGDRRSTT